MIEIANEYQFEEGEKLSSMKDLNQRWKIYKNYLEIYQEEFHFSNSVYIALCITFLMYVSFTESISFIEVDFYASLIQTIKEKSEEEWL